MARISRLGSAPVAMTALVCITVLGALGSVDETALVAIFSLVLGGAGGAVIGEANGTKRAVQALVENGHAEAADVVAHGGARS